LTETDDDLSDGSAPTGIIHNINDDLQDQKQKRSFRTWIFWTFGALSFAMFVGLFCELTRLLTYNELIINSSAQDWHASLLLIAVLLIYASVPLSIVISLMRMSSTPKSKDDDDPLFTSPQIEFLKTIASLVSSAKS